MRWAFWLRVLDAESGFPSIPIPIATPTPILLRHRPFPSGLGEPPAEGAEGAVAFSTLPGEWVGARP